MTISLSQTCLPVCAAMLGHLGHLLDKARTDAQARGFDVNVHITERLAPDMLPLARQIQIASDAAKACMARLAGQELPMSAGDLLVAPADVPHGVRNNSEGRLLVMAVLAPAP